MKRFFRACRALLGTWILLGLCLPPPLPAVTWQKGRLAAELTGYLEANVTAPLRDSPHEDPSGRLQLNGTCDYGDHLRFTLTTKITYDGTVREPKDGNPFQEFDQVYQGKAPMIEFEEAYLEFRQEKWELKAGIQKVHWGKLDELNPADNVNPQDFSHFVIDSLADRKIGIPMLKLNVYPSWETTLELVWVPVMFPYRLQRPGERWFPPIFTAPDSVDPGIPGIPPVDIVAHYSEIDLPSQTMENSEAAFRLSTTVAGFDVAVSYFYGFDTYTPTIGGDGFVEIGLVGRPPFVEATYYVDLAPQLSRVHVWGLELGKAVGPITIRSEWAYFRGGLHNRKIDTEAMGEMPGLPSMEEIFREMLENLMETGEAKTDIPLSPELSLKRDALRGGVGLDYIYGDYVLSGQLLLNWIPKHDPQLIPKAVEVSVTMNLRGTFMDETLQAEMSGMYNFSQGSLLLRPEVSYKILEDLKGSIRFVYIDGPHDSLLGQYSDNDQVQFRLRYSF